MTVDTVSSSVAEILDALGVEAENSGAFDGAWIKTHGERVESLNPATGEPLAAVRLATAEDYERVAAVTLEAFREWRTWPAPRRGEVVRQLGEELRRHKDELGRLVTLEVGKVLSEGLGEVQEMIDMADLAVGMSRQLYGLSMHSERPQPPDVRAVAPAGAGGHHHRLQLPRRRLGLERHGGRRLRRLDDLEALAPGAA